VHSKNQCILENGEEDEKFEEAILTRAIAKVAVEVVLKSKPAKEHCSQV